MTGTTGFRRRVGPVRLPLEVASGRVEYFTLWYFEAEDGGRWVAAVLGQPDGATPVPLRIESACFFGHVLGSRQCDCGFQLREAFLRIAERGIGLVIYGVDQDARGNGLETHFRIYDYRQNEDLDTDEVYRRLHAPLDARSYAVVPAILAALSVNRVDLLSNNPNRIAFLRSHGIEVLETPIEASIDRYNMATLMLEKEDLAYRFSFRTHADWLRPVQDAVAGWIDRRSGAVVRYNNIVLAQWTGDEWDVAAHLTANLPEQAEPSEDLIVYLSDLPRHDEIDRYAAIGAGFVVVPFARLPAALVDRARRNGIRLQDWGRSNAYITERPQWLPVEGEDELYERAGERRHAGTAAI